MVEKAGFLHVMLIYVVEPNRLNRLIYTFQNLIFDMVVFRIIFKYLPLYSEDPEIIQRLTMDINQNP